ncbi:4-alpha-glucanotransferase [Amnibacterium sp.]|uniref:4-alpha-glucanotransferase n=1 Tax=Amnibacterium sp. TaxID=1872496 RepID=UPI003F7C174A
MTLPDQSLLDLADAYGVATSFTDWRGETRTVSTETLTAVLGALGADPADPGAALRDRWDEPWRRTLPACTVATEGEERLVWMHVPDGAPAVLAVELEGGGRLDLEQVDQWVPPREVDGRRIGEATFRIPAGLPMGYHRLVASSDGIAEEDAPLIVTPARVGMPASMGDRRGWVLSTQLYSVRSAGSWGVGDLTDLTDLGVWAGADLGADSVLVNPLHAAEPVPPLEPSPYLPSSRRFFHPLYLRVEAVPEYAALPSRARARITVLARRVRERASGEAIDRDAAWSAKREALRLLFAVPRSAGRERDLAAFRRREGVALTDFATWSVLAETYGNDARQWPEGLRSPGSPEVAAFAAEHEAAIDFACWLQWLLDEQLAHAQDKALCTGMGIGVMHDLAVGVHPGGADAWRLGDVYAQGVSVGAPPDPFNQLGQNWLQPPWRPDALEAAAYAPFRDIIRAVLRHAGGVRVDHIIGLFRLWWVPEGADADRGAYVHYDHEALIGVLALEAVRAGAVVVGEDLGVVDPSARAYFASRGILGTSILWFEREDGAPLPAERWREQCLASVTTHDLPPTAGYLEGAHVRLRAELGLLTRPVEEELAADREEQRGWLDEIRRRGLLGDDAGEEATVLALHRYLTLTPARLLNAALVDLVGDRRTQNQPGTVDEYPNWRVPLSGPDGEPMTLEAVFASERAARLAAILR